MMFFKLMIQYFTEYDSEYKDAIGHDSNTTFFKVTGKKYLTKKK